MKKESFVRGSIGIVIFIIIWVLAVTQLDISRTFLPAPWDIGRAFQGMAPYLPRAIMSSLRITMSGFAIGISVGIGMGLLMAYSRNFMEIAGPMMEFTRPVPVFALIPLFMIWFGLGLMPQILLIALGVSGVLGVQTYEAVRNIPMVYVNASANLGAGKNFIFRTVILPYIFPHIIGAIRVAAAASWGLNVAAEFMGVQTGLGFIMIVRQMFLDTSGIIAVVLIYSVLAILLDQIIRIIERRLTKWTDRSKMSLEKLK